MSRTRIDAAKLLLALLLKAHRQFNWPKPTTEFQFDKTRKWRFDIAWPEYMVAVEVEGIKPNGKSRHQNFSGYRKDCEKYNAAVEQGWTLLRYPTPDIDQDPTDIINQIGRVLRRERSQP